MSADSLSLPPFGLSEEQLEFRDTLRRFFEVHAPMTEVRRVLESDQGLAPDLRKAIDTEIGLSSIAIPESAGGQGFGLRELGIAVGEVGRALAPVPLLASSGLAARVVGAVLTDDEEREEWLGPFASGSVGTLAWMESAGGDALDRIETEARGTGRDRRLQGEKRFVLDAAGAERIFVVAHDPERPRPSGLGLFAVEAGADGLSLEPLASLDPTRRLARVRLDDVPARRVGPEEGATRAIARGLEEATALLCAEMVGGMERVLETAVDHARTRRQFGRAIGSFQAIKHKCADMLIDFEASRTATASALEALDEGDPEAGVLASVAKARTGPAFVRMATENVQIHGGVGYTWEYDAHLYYRRAHGSAILLGDAAWHHDRLARALAGRAGGSEDGATASRASGERHA